MVWSIYYLRGNNPDHFCSTNITLKLSDDLPSSIGCMVFTNYKETFCGFRAVAAYIQALSTICNTLYSPYHNNHYAGITKDFGISQTGQETLIKEANGKTDQEHPGGQYCSAKHTHANVERQY